MAETQPVVENAQDFARLTHPRRPFTPAPSDGPVSASVEQARPAGDPTIPLGGQTSVMGEQGRGAPLLPPSPAPSPPSLMLTPMTYRNPNHYEFPLQNGRRQEVSPVATPARGNQLAYDPRRDWRRPASIIGAPVSPGGE